jgi:hypothetical protein
MPFTAVTLVESPASCRDTDLGFGMIPSELPAAGEFHSVTVTVGTTRIHAGGNVPEAELRRLVGDVRSFDLAAQPIQRSMPPAG